MSALGSPWRCRQSTDVQGIECVVVVVRRRQAERLQTRQSRQSRKWGESNSSATRRGRFRRRGAQLGRAQLRRTGRSVFAPSAAVQSQRGPPPKRPGGDWGVFDPRAVRERQRAKRHNCGQRSQCRVSLEQSWHGHRPLREKGTGAATVKLRAPAGCVWTRRWWLRSPSHRMPPCFRVRSGSLPSRYNLLESALRTEAASRRGAFISSSESSSPAPPPIVTGKQACSRSVPSSAGLTG